MKLRICIQAENSASATVFSVYAPTLPSSDTTKERFYEELCRALRAASTTDKRIVLGDFNARVGSCQETWDRVLGRFGNSVQRVFASSSTIAENSINDHWESFLRFPIRDELDEFPTTRDISN